MKDTLIHAISANGHIRVLTCTSTQLAEQARKQHNLWPTSAAALGRVLTITAILGSMLKTEKEKVTVQINGGGPIGTIMADGWANGDVRGFVGDPEIYLKYNDTGKLAVGTAVGKDGYLKVIKRMNMKNDFTGQVALVSGEIGEDFHDLELCMPKPRVACLESTVAPLIQGSGLIDTRIHARKGGQSLTMFKTHRISNLSQKLRTQRRPDPFHRHDDRILGELAGNLIHRCAKCFNMGYDFFEIANGHLHQSLVLRIFWKDRDKILSGCVE